MSNSTRFSDSRKQTRVLLSIRPKFARAILRGYKRYEFRRRIFARHVDVVVMYVTSPVASVVAEFDVDNIIRAPLPKLWEQTRNYAGIDEELFLQYFDGNKIGYAIQVGSIREYVSPFCLKEELGLSPPQSFVYLDSFDLEAHLT